MSGYADRNAEIAVRDLEMIRLTGGRVCLSGSEAVVSGVLQQQQRAGRLLAVTDPAPNGRGGILVTMRLAPAVQRPLATPPRRRSRRCTVTVAAVAVAIAAAAAAVVALVAMWLAAHLLQVLGILALLALILLGAGRVGVCPGIHCPGCRHR